MFMDFIKNLNDLIENILVVEKYLNSNDSNEREYAIDLVRRGKTILVYKVNGENHFAPSRFIGYRNNSLSKHAGNDEKDGRDTNPVIDQIVGRSFSNDKIEKSFIDYCIKLGIETSKNKRKYWRIKQDGKYFDLKDK
jgi:hypothetical protein